MPSKFPFFNINSHSSQARDTTLSGCDGVTDDGSRERAVTAVSSPAEGPIKLSSILKTSQSSSKRLDKSRFNVKWSAEAKTQDGLPYRRDCSSIANKPVDAEPTIESATSLAHDIGLITEAEVRGFHQIDAIRSDIACSKHLPKPVIEAKKSSLVATSKKINSANFEQAAKALDRHAESHSDKLRYLEQITTDLHQGVSESDVEKLSFELGWIVDLLNIFSAPPPIHRSSTTSKFSHLSSSAIPFTPSTAELQASAASAASDAEMLNAQAQHAMQTENAASIVSEQKSETALQVGIDLQRIEHSGNYTHEECDALWNDARKAASEAVQAEAELHQARNASITIKERARAAVARAYIAAEAANQAAQKAESTLG
jgi:hypothetical protein